MCEILTEAYSMKKSSSFKLKAAQNQKEILITPNKIDY
jgi:hypothetical protein